MSNKTPLQIYQDTIMFRLKENCKSEEKIAPAKHQFISVCKNYRFYINILPYGCKISIENLQGIEFPDDKISKEFLEENKFKIMSAIGLIETKNTAPSESVEQGSLF